MFNLANKPLYALLRLWMSSQDLPCVPDLVFSGNIIMIMLVLTILIISWWSSPSHCMGCRMPDRSITAKQAQTSCKLPTIIIIIIAIIIATITVSSSSPLWTLSALHLQPWWSSQFTAPDREGGKANIVQIVQTWLKPKCCQAPHNASWSYYIMFIVNHCDCKSHGIQLLFGIGRHQMKVGKKMSKETVSCVRVHTRPLRHLPDCHS